MSIFKKLFGSNKKNSPDDRKGLRRDDSSESPKFSLNDMMDKQFLHFEAIYRHQHIVIRRSNEENRITLGEILNSLFEIETSQYISLAIVARNTISYEIQTTVTTNIEDIVGFDLFGCILKNRYEGHYTQGMSNEVTLIITTKQQKFVINITSLGGSPEMKYIKLVIISPAEKADDDLRSLQSGNEPVVTSFVLSFVEDGHEEALKKYEKIENNLVFKQKNGEELDDFERELVHGQLEFQGYWYIGYGKWLFEQSRYYDTYSMLSRAYNYMKADIHNAPDDIKEVFYEVCSLIGSSLSKIGREDEALYYFRVARDGGKIDNSINYIESLARLGNATAMRITINIMKQMYADVYGDNPDTWPKEAQDLIQKIYLDLIQYKDLHDANLERYPKVNTQITIGYLLKTLYGVQDYDLLPNMVVYDQKKGVFIGTITEKTEIINYLFNVEDSFDKTFTLALTHSRNDSKSNGDESILANLATLTIMTHKVKSENNLNLMRLDIIRGPYPNDDDRREPVRANIPLYSSLVLGIAESETFGASKEECIKCFQYADQIHHQHRFLEASKLYKWVFENVSDMLKTNKGTAYSLEDEELWELFFESAFNVGFCLMELGSMVSASYYLSQAIHSNIYAHAQEYINCLANTKAPIALDVINEVLANSPKPSSESEIDAWKHHMAFLKRRKSYVLIDYKEYDKAEELLKEMIDDPLCKEFAEGELNYIKEIREK